MKYSLKGLIAVVAALLWTGLSLPVLPAPAMAMGDAEMYQVVAELWDGSSGYIETEFASVTGSVDGLAPVSVAGLWDGNEGMSEPMVFASATGSLDGLPPTPVADLWDGSEGMSELMEFASAARTVGVVALTPVPKLSFEKTSEKATH